VTSDDCDDGKPCDGQEACVAGFCAEGEARSCEPNLECSDSEGGACVFADGSPWITRNGLGDNGPYFSSDQDLGVVPGRDDSNSEVHLVLFSLSGRHSTDRFDAISPDSEYRDVVNGANNQFVAYSKGVSPDYDGAYVDLRYETGGDPKPVRFPGEGTLRSFNFDSSGTAIYYIREQQNGSRDCYYLDLSRQVAQAPVKVNRDGRTDHCMSQPLTP
jgi:hypothetical protein